MRLLFFFVLILVRPAFAFETRWVCATEPLSTSFSLIDDGDAFELQFVHHHGVEFMPVHRGLIVAADRPELDRKARLFARLGARGSVTFQKSECTADGKEWTCQRSGPVKIGDLVVDSPRIALRERHVGTRRVTLDLLDLELSFTLGGQGFAVPMEYPQDACSFHQIGSVLNRVISTKKRELPARGVDQEFLTALE